MKFKIFRKEIKITTKQLFKFVAFCFFVAISAYLSLNMFVQLGHERSEKIAMVAISIGVEAYKVFLTISLSTILFSLIYYFKKWIEVNRKNKKIATKKTNQYTTKVITSSFSSLFFLILYLVTAFTSITASLGYALTTVNRYTEERQTINNSALILATEKASTGYSETIASYNSMIVTSNKTIQAYGVEAAKTYPEGQEWRVTSAINNMNNVQKKVVEYNDKIVELRNKIIENDIKITNLKLEEANTALGSGSTKSMFELIGKEVNAPASRIMFLMIAILSFVIELGILTTSPHGGIDEVEEKEIEKETKVVEKKDEVKKSKPQIEKKVEVKESKKEEIKEPVVEKVVEKVIEEVKKEIVFEEIPTNFFENSDKEAVDFQNDFEDRFEMVVKDIEDEYPKNMVVKNVQAPNKGDSITIKKKHIPQSSINANIEDVINDLDKVPHKEYTEEEKKRMLSLLNEKTPIKNKDKVAKLIEDI